MRDRTDATAPHEVTRLLEQWAAGDDAALDRVTEALYGELRALAAAFVRRERPGHTLQPTALIHEAYLRLNVTAPQHFENRRQFMGLTAKVMRQVLVDHARRAQRAKRGGGVVTVALTGEEAGGGTPIDALLELDDALTQLAAYSERQARVLELRYFGGYGVEQVADILGISAPTVSRDQRGAEAWLNQWRQGGAR